jgi:hypothetical protein
LQELCQNYARTLPELCQTHVPFFATMSPQLRHYVFLRWCLKLGNQKGKVIVCQLIIG